ncbi:MAG: T9SS C-terminal target domain-containing protein, partial [Flavobacteriia bacterium]|nr:T9SS C-terminal target domain-containing protein [Flavobacteriia bacterium]
SAEPMEGALYDLQGRRVQGFSVPAGQDRVEVSTQDLPTGIYLLKIQTPNGLHAEKILID